MKYLQKNFWSYAEIIQLQLIHLDDVHVLIKLCNFFTFEKKTDMILNGNFLTVKVFPLAMEWGMLKWLIHVSVWEEHFQVSGKLLGPVSI